MTLDCAETVVTVVPTVWALGAGGPGDVDLLALPVSGLPVVADDHLGEVALALLPPLGVPAANLEESGG